MRKYYLFIIKKTYYNTYKNKSYVLYQVLETLKNAQTYDFSYGINVYKSLCMPFPIKLLYNYFEKRISYNLVNSKVMKINSHFEETYVEIKHSCIIIKSNVSFPEILKIFNIYNKNIFVCDFNHKDFFWLNDVLKKTTLKI